MISGIRKKYRALFIATVCVATLIFALDTFGAFALNEVTLDGKVIPLVSSKALGFVPGASVLRQPLDLTAILMCRRVGIGAAHVEVSSLHGINIETNKFNPKFLVHDANSNTLLGLTENLVIAPIDVEEMYESAPLFIGLKGLRDFERPNDSRLGVIAYNLQTLQDQDETLYSMISVIDCSKDEFVTVSFLNTEMLLLTNAMTISESIMKLQAVISGATKLTQESTVVDMRFEGLMIIPSENPKKSNSKHSSSKINRHG